MQRIQVYLPESLIEEIEKFAEDKGIKFPDQIRRALDEWVESKKGLKRRDG
jgi:metal-responsive CopG/Arc/MetJ family transcriptional regulator